MKRRPTAPKNACCSARRRHLDRKANSRLRRTLSSENYSYNEAGQLTQTQETPVGGKGCITRLYGYTEGSGERESATTRTNEKGECTTEGGLSKGISTTRSGVCSIRA